jgi:hypothetical protein
MSFSDNLFHSASLRTEEIRPVGKLGVIQRVLRPIGHSIKPASLTVSQIIFQISLLNKKKAE